MEKILEYLFLVAADIVSTIGIALSIMLIGLLPIYVIAACIYLIHIPIRNSLLSTLGYILGLAVSIAMIAIFVVSAMILGQWG